MIEIVARIDGLVTEAQSMERGHYRRHLGDQSNRRVPIALGIAHIPRRVEHPHGRHAGLQGIHRMAGFRQAFDQISELIFDAAMMTELIVKVGQLALSG